MLEKNQAAMERCRTEAEVATRAKRNEMAAAATRQLGRLKDSSEKIAKQYELLFNLSKMLDQGLETARIKLRENEEAMTLAIETNAAMADADATAQDMLTAIYGDKGKIITFTDAMKVIANQTAASIGSLEGIMGELAPVMSEVELGRMVDEERGARILASLGTQEQGLLSAKPESLSFVGAGEEREPVLARRGTSGSDLASLFDTTTKR